MKPTRAVYWDLFLVLLFSAVVIGATGYNRKARLIPLVVGIPCLSMAVAQLIIDLKGKRKKGISGEDALYRDVMERVAQQQLQLEEARSAEAGADRAEEGPREEYRSPVSESRKLALIVGWILGFVGLEFLFGFSVTVPVFTLAFMRSRGERWLPSLAYAAGLWALIYVCFVLAAQSTLFEGYVFTLLRANQ